MNSKAIMGIAVLTAALAGTTNAALKWGVEITGAAADSAWGFLPPVAAADESGLTDDLHDGGVSGHEWLSNTQGTNHWWSVEFDQAYELGDAWIWNSRWAEAGTTGFRSVDVYYTPEGGGADVLLDNFEFNIATGTAPIAPQTAIPFDGVLATGVRFQQVTDWGHPWGSGGLQEVRFHLSSESPELPTQPPIQIPTNQRQLFLDDYVVASTLGLQKTMHQPEKRGAVVWPNQPWETTLQTRSVPAWDENENIYKLWMITSTPLAGVGGATYAESTDGINWTKPILHQYVYDGSTANNFINVGAVQLEWPDNAMENVVYDPDDPDPSRRYKGFLDAYGRQPIVSPDGIHWTKLSVPEIPSQDESNLSYDRSSGTFIATLKTGGAYGRAQGIWTSTDFETWTNTGIVFQADATDQVRAVQNIAARLADPTLQQPIYNNPAEYKADIYNLGIFEYEGQYVGMPSVFHKTGGSDGFHLIQLASSRDLGTWQRLGDRQPFIGPSPVGEGAYDLTQLLPPSAPVVHGDELWFYYTGIKYRVRPEDPDPNMGAICLAVLRRDGFISMDAGEEPGTLLTKPFVLPEGSFLINAKTSPGGSILARLLDADGLLIDGYDLVDSDPFSGDSVTAYLTWGGQAIGEDLLGQTVSVEFRLQDASLYSFGFSLYSGVEGDFDLDDDVDGMDFLEWQRGESPVQWSTTDLGLWQTNFGKVAPLTAASTTVPEPTSLLLFGLGVVSATSYRRQFG